MSAVGRKLLVLLPVLLLGGLYFWDHQDAYRHAGVARLLFLFATVLLFYGWIFLDVQLRKQASAYDLGLQASFYVFVFMVLTLTGYFILYREVSAHDWWHRMMVRIARRDHVNFHLFKMFRIYRVFSRQIIGNFIMLLPLGIFLPLMYRKATGLFPVFAISLLASTTIELLQLVTSFRSADVDDIFLNTLGACAGYLVFRLVALAIRPAGTDRMVWAGS